MLGRTLIACFPLLTLGVGFAQDRTALGPGEVEGAITRSNPPVRARVLGGPGYTRTSRGVLYALTVPTGGVWTIRMESDDFDAYLVLRDAQGTVLAEDDDGWILPDAQLQIELEANRLYLLDACALHQSGGSFRLSVLEMASEQLTAEERLAAGLERLREAMETQMSTLGPYHPATVAALEQLAWQLWWQGHYAEVVGLLRPLLAACEALRGPEHPDTARCLRHLADSLALTGAREEAEAMQRRALAIRERTFGPRGAETFDSLCALATHLMDEGRNEEAEVFIVRARELVRAASPEELEGHRDGLLLVARHLRNEGRLEEAERCYRQALGGTLSGSSLAYSPGAMLGLAQTLLGLGRAEEAESLFHRARTAIVEQWGSRHRSLISAHGGLAELALQRGELTVAHEHRLAAWELARDTFGEGHAVTATPLLNLAHVRQRMGELETVVPLYARALEIRTAQLGPGHLATARSRRSLALRMLDLGQAEEGWQLAHQGTADARARLIELFAECSEADRYRYAADHAWSIHTLLSLTAAAQSPEHEHAAFKALADWKGVVFRTLSRLPERVDPEQERILGELRGVRRRLSRLLYESTDRAAQTPPGRITALFERRTELESELSRLVSAQDASARVDLDSLAAALDESSVYVDYYIGRRYRPARRISGPDGPERIEPGGWSPPSLTAFVVHPDRSLVRIEIGEVEPIQEAVERYLEQLVTHRGVALPEREPDPGLAMHELLWAPIAGQIGSAKRIFIAADGFLGCLPFETLQEADGTYLIEKHAFAYVQDAESLLRSAALPARGTPASILTLGAVDYDAPEGEPVASELLAASSSPLRGGLQPYWLPLPDTGREAEGIGHLARQFLGSQVDIVALSGAKATEELLEASLPGRQVLHLATHGFFQPAGLTSLWTQAQEGSAPEEAELERERRLASGHFPALLSGLVLAGANQPPREGREDGFLTADEIAWLDLRACQLVVLSACETGLGAARAGEGMASLRRAFHQAGARTAVSSLWRVRDHETMELMTDFYRRLWKERLGPLEALRGAQLEMLRRNRARYRGEGRPSTWGGFVLSGDWR